VNVNATLVWRLLNADTSACCTALQPAAEQGSSSNALHTTSSSPQYVAFHLHLVIQAIHLPASMQGLTVEDVRGMHYTEASVLVPEGYDRGEAQHCHCYALLRKAALVNGILNPLELALHHC